MNPGKLREDILVSICFAEAEDPEVARARIAPLAEALKARYRYWEILIVNEIGRETAFEPVLAALPNLRYLSVAPGLDGAQRRVVGASEAIGDIVVMTSPSEVAAMDIPAMIEEAHEAGAVVIGRRASTATAEPLIVALGRASGFQASSRDMQTMAIPRTVLNRLLEDANPVLALRFPPRDSSVKVIRRAPDTPVSAFGGASSRLSSRFDLLMRMVTDAGPALLGGVAALSALMVLGAILFAVYVVAVYLTHPQVAEGWTTLSLAISGTLGFLGAALFAICITLRKVAEIIRGGAVDHLVAERSSVDLFDSVANALNVDTDGSDGAAASGANSGAASATVSGAEPGKGAA